MFRDRADAGQRLARKLKKYRGTKTIIMALPRGGVVLGHEIARTLSLSIDIIVVRKIGHPLNPEYAIGAVDEYGTTILNEIETAKIDKRWLEEEILGQKNEAKRRSTLYLEGKGHLDVEGKTVVIVDDGIATGFTVKLAIRTVKQKGPKEIVVAVPIAPPESVYELEAEEVDEIILLEKPEKFLGAVGAHYQEFEQVDDDEVIRLLR